jgi:hypothetical protein
MNEPSGTDSIPAPASAAATPANPATKEPKMRSAPEGYAFVKSQYGMLWRMRDRAAQTALAIHAELKRCGVHTRKLKVREFRGALYLNLFCFNGLDPLAAWTLLKSLPNYCGYKRVMKELEHLPERVATGVTP